VQGSRPTAVATSSLTNSIGDTEALVDDLLEAERDAIPQH
jgi:hypothetical protein